MKHCNKELEIKSGKQDGKTLFYAECKVCGMKHKDPYKDGVEYFFNTQPQKKEPQPQNNQLAPLPKRNELQTWMKSNMPALINQSAQFIDKPATTRMIEKNIRYVSNLSGKAWDKIWSTPEGQDSILNGFSEALYYGAILGEMGDLVPFGNGCEFIPGVECYEHAMSSGKNPPFSDIKIFPIYKNDTRKVYQKDGNFTVELEYGIPRGDVIAIVVQAKRNDTGYVVGEVYDVDRLIEKAAHHSPSYKNYLMEKDNFFRLKTEGKLDKDQHGRDCIKKTGKYGEYYIYESDLKNPYDGPDRPEMLRKAAGKSFFRPYMKVRNASAMAAEWSEDETITDDMSRDQVADSVLDKAMGQFQSEGHPYKDPQNIKDAEIVEEKEKTVEKKSNNKEDEEIKEL